MIVVNAIGEMIEIQMPTTSTMLTVEQLDGFIAGCLEARKYATGELKYEDGD